MRCQAAAQSVARTNASHSSLAKQDDGANAPYSALCAVQPSLLEALRFSTFVGRVPRLVLKDTPSDKKSAEPEGGFPPLSFHTQEASPKGYRSAYAVAYRFAYGKFRGKRKIWGGRAKVGCVLYMATLVAVRFNEDTPPGVAPGA